MGQTVSLCKFDRRGCGVLTPDLPGVPNMQRCEAHAITLPQRQVVEIYIYKKEVCKRRAQYKEEEIKSTYWDR